MKVSTEIDNNFGYEKITQLVDNIPLNMDLQLTRKLRRKENRLFISSVAPYKCVGKDTIARWIKTVMNSAGISVNNIY